MKVNPSRIVRSGHVHPAPEHVSERDVRPGDQIAVQLQIEGVHIWHHGIVIRGRSTWQHDVIDFGSVDSPVKDFQHKTVADFRCGVTNKFVRISYRPGESYPRKRVTKQAKYFFEHPAEFGDYNLVTNNCEHFATFVKTGVRISEQVVRVLRGDLHEMYRLVHEYIQAKLNGAVHHGVAQRHPEQGRPSSPRRATSPAHVHSIATGPQQLVNNQGTYSRPLSAQEAYGGNSNGMPGSTGLLKWRVITE